MPSKNPKTTTIPITHATRGKLKDLGHKGETYDSIIIRLIQKHNGA